MRIWKVKSNENDAEIGTTPLRGDTLDRILKSLNLVFDAGVNEQALKAPVDR